MAKNANKILKEIAIKMGGNVGEKDNDTNELLASIATSLGATPDGKKNSNELLEIIAENVGEGGSGGASLPFGQTNPDCYFYKVFSSNTSIITIDFTKFAHWFSKWIDAGDSLYTTEWADGSRANTIELMKFFVNYNKEFSIQSFLLIKINSSTIDLILQSDYNDKYSVQIVNASNGKSVLECLSEVGVVTITLDDEMLQHGYSYTYPNESIPCMLVKVLSVEYNVYNSFNSFDNDIIKYIDSIDWLKISENN